jgi:ATP-dependent Lon protease
MSNLLPVLVTRGIICFPSISTPMDVGREKSILAVNAAINKFNTQIIVVSQVNTAVEEPKAKDIYMAGTLCNVKIDEKFGEDGYKITVTGIKRVKLTKVVDKAFMQAEYEEVVTIQNDPKNIKNSVMAITSAFEDFIDSKVFDNAVSNLKKSLSSYSENPEIFVDQLASAMPMSLAKKQSIIEEEVLDDRLGILWKEAMRNNGPKDAKNAKDKDNAKIDNEINKKVNDNLNKQQREYYLRERLRTIKEELGDISTKDVDVEKIRTRLNGSPYPEYIKKRVNEELSRFESMPPSSQEANIIKTYIDWVIELPWWQLTEDNKDIEKVKKVLDDNHYGLEKVKERIIEYIAVRMRSNSSKSPILCLVGPPGVGKTSLAKSIADALDKKFVKMSLGGIKDESEIRGHRKTYLGSLPGRIIQGMKKAQTLNPLFLLDEVDKMSSDYRGDPASAMLEVLDPEQNKVFSDNYIEEDYDLSKVMFVATANYYEQIPEALIDRMEIIELSSYTAIEKLEITKTHLISKIVKDSGLKDSELSFKDEAISYIISRYTREAGVRDLERQISKIARKFIVRQMKEKVKSEKIDINAVKKYLGREIFEITEKDKLSLPGVVNGMAYTTAGGDLLPIEVSLFPGKGNIVITGNLKETMKESASVALGYVRSNAEKFKIEHNTFKEFDFHIHVPQGGVPKDGPSAGVTLTTAIISAITKIKVSSKISMTGEITLRGRVMIIGGVKEKVISAHRGGVRTIFIPKADERYLEEVPKEILDEIQINLVETYDEIYEKIFKV